jgi:hypothetical protein
MELKRLAAIAVIVVAAYSMGMRLSRVGTLREAAAWGLDAGFCSLWAWLVWDAYLEGWLG